MSLPMMKPGGGRPPRVKPVGLAYINIEPDNGGIVLNVSEGGLCFHSVAPVQRGGKTLRCWFSAEGSRVEAQGRLAWLDEKGKTGGLQFKSLSPMARQRIQSWMAESAEPFSAGRKPGPVRQLPQTPTSAKANPRAVAVAAALGAIQKFALLQMRQVKAIRWNEYSRGLATGLLIGLVVASVVLFRANRRQFGEALIRVGEHFAPRPQQVSTGIPKPSAAVNSEMANPASPAPASQTVAPPAAKPKAPEPDVTPQTSARTPKAISPPKPTPKLEKAAPSAPPPTPADALPTGLLPGASLPLHLDAATPTRPDSAEQPARETRTAEVKPTVPPADDNVAVAEVNSGVPFGKYLELGKFKDQWRANEEIDNLNHLGTSATVVQQNLLWMTSYQVLAGPYHNDDQTRQARRNLQSEGFNPHSLPKRSRRLTFWAPTNGIRKADVLVGEFVVSWEPYSADVTVKFIKEDGRVVTGQARWDRRDTKYSNDGIEYQTNDDGSRSLVQIWFKGMKQAVALSDPSGRHGVNF